MADIFVSYARADKARVAPLIAALEAQGFSIWWDPAISPGQEFDDLIRNELTAARAVIVVWTPASVLSRWVRGEARLGAERGVLVPVRFDFAQLPIDVLSIHTTDLDQWDQSTQSNEFKSLLRALNAIFAPDSQLNNAARQAEGESALSIAVLPFVTMSADPEQEYFSDGLSEELINELAHLKGLRVAGRTSSFAFKGRTGDLRMIGQTLGVKHVLEGSVRKAGSRLRITAQLIKCGDGFHLWSEAYDRELQDVFAIQEDVARAVSEALGVALGIRQTARAPSDTTRFEVYDKYLRAAALLRSLSSPTDFLGAVGLLREALSLDPDFAPARGILAAVYTMVLILFPASSEQTLNAMKETVQDALTRAPEHWASHSANGLLLMHGHDWLGAEAAFEKARALAPASESNVGVMCGLFLTTIGHSAEAVRLVEATRSTDPLSPIVSAALQIFLDVTGRSDDAQAEYERTKNLPGARRGVQEHQHLYRIWGSGDSAAIKAQQHRYLDNQMVQMPVLNKVYEIFDQPQAALELLDGAFSDPAYQDPTRLMLLALYVAHFGDSAFALSVMRRAFVDMKGLGLLVSWYPVMREVRRLPEFKALLRDVGLHDYWRQSGKWGEFARPLGDDDFEIIR